jgi:endonuclease/exonuclease/phosphatase family metal-dependent hydrolase
MRSRPFVPAALAIAWGLAAPALAQTGTFSTLTYNVAGLLEPFSSSNPATNTPLISCRIRGYTLVNVQEDFNYHAALYDSCDDHPYRSPTSGGMGVGSGLNTLSYLPYADWYRGDWTACNGVDCLTPKGWTHARVRLAEGTYLSLYNVHTQAQVEEADLSARRSNMLQLLEYIEANSPTDAVIIMGDTNTRYTRSGDNIREALKRGFTDVWLQNVRGGSVPAAGDAALTNCSPLTSAACEVVDKVLYRGNPHLALNPLDYLLDGSFTDSAGNQLSDHYPISVNWSYSTAAARLRLSDSLGGPHGNAFNDAGTLPAEAAVGRVVIRTGTRVDRIETQLTSGYVMGHGGSGGTEASLALGSNEYLAAMSVCTGQHDGRTRIFHVRFTTTAGRTLAGGSTTGSCATYSAPSGWQIAGFHGRSGDEVDKIGAVFMPIPAARPATAGFVQVVNQQSGLCLDIAGATPADGANVQQWACNGGDWQKWSYDAQTGLVRSQADPRYCLDNSGSFNDGANIALWTCTGNANQRFSWNAATGVLSMRTFPAQVVDAIGTAAGGDVITYGDWGGANQRWRFVP